MDNFFEKEGLNINHQHKTWTPDDRIKYEKAMIMYRIKISACLVLGTAVLIALLSLIFKFI